MRPGVSYHGPNAHFPQLHCLIDNEHLDRHCNPIVRMNITNIVELPHDVILFQYAV